MENIRVLRPIRDDELETMLAWRNAPSIRLNMYTQHEISIEEHMSWWKKVKQRKDQQYFMYEMTGLAMGIVGFNDIDTNNQHSFWAFYASPEAPRGVGSNMEFLALEYAFNTLKLHKLSCEVLAFNENVIKLHKKFGFEVEGIFRKHHKLEDKFVDVYRLGMLASEWHEQRPSMQAKIDKLNRRQIKP